MSADAGSLGTKDIQRLLLAAGEARARRQRGEDATSVQDDAPVVPIAGPPASAKVLTVERSDFVTDWQSTG